MQRRALPLMAVLVFIVAAQERRRPPHLVRRRPQQNNQNELNRIFRTKSTGTAVLSAVRRPPEEAKDP